MNRSVLRKRRVLICLLSVVLGAVTGLGATKAKAPKQIQPEVLDKELIEELLDAARRAEPEWKDDRALISRKGAALPPDPDNAALLYYQAMLTQPQPDAATRQLIDEVLRGAEPDEKIRKYLNQQSCRNAIKLAEAAARIPECNWGLLQSQGLGFNDEAFRRFYFLLAIDARTLAADGDYRAALGQCLTLRRLARHVHEWFFSSLAVEKKAFTSIRDILGSMPPDADILTWLQGQLVLGQAVPEWSAELLEADFEFMLRLLYNEPDTLAGHRKDLAEKAADNSAKKAIQALTDEELLAPARHSYEKFLNSVLRVIGSDMPYEKAYAELQRLMDKLEEQTDSDPVVILRHCVDQVGKFYNIQIRHTAEFNALRAAIEIYLVMAKTGQLPKTLPDYLPKDPFTGKDFAYEITDDGFVLSCPDKNIPEARLQRYEFKVRK